MWGVWGVWEDGGRASELKKMEEKEKGKKYFRTHEDLAIYQLAFETAMNVLRRCGKCGRIREGRKKLIQSQSAPLSSHTSPSSHPPHTLERRSSRSVCANLAEAWRKRRYKAAFMAKLNDCEAEAAETQVWLKFAVKCQYLTVEQGRELYGTYNQVLSGLVKMITHPDDWLLD